MLEDYLMKLQENFQDKNTRYGPLILVELYKLRFFLKYCV